MVVIYKMAADYYMDTTCPECGEPLAVFIDWNNGDERVLCDKCGHRPTAEYLNEAWNENSKP